MSEKSVTIGIPFYNDSLYLEQAIKSVFNQSYTDWKLVLIDDNSSDGSLEIAQRYSDDCRVSVISDGENKKLASRLNQIIDVANTKYIARMDADDIMHVDRLKTQIEIMERNSSIDVLGSNAISIDDSNNILGVRNPVSRKLVKVESFIHPSILAKTSWFKSNHYNELADRAQDSLLWNSTKNESNFFSIMQPLLYYREVEGSYYKKYFESSISFFKVLLGNKDSLSIYFLLKMAVTSFLKGTVYFVFSIFDKEYFLIRKRSLPLDKEDFTFFCSQLNSALE